MASSGNDNEMNFEATLRQHIKNSGAANVAVCDRFDPDTANAYLERAMSQTALSAYETHLADCTICRRHIIELSRLMPQVETKAVETIAPENSAPTFLAGIRQWLSGWRLGAIAGLGVATAALILFFVNVQFSPKQSTVAVAEKPAEAQAPFREASVEPKDQLQPQANVPVENNAKIMPSASPANTGQLTDLSAKKSAEHEMKINGAAAENTAAAPPPPAPLIATAPGIVAAPKREDAANNLGQQNQISASEWQRATPTPTPRGPAVNQMQVDRALAMKQIQAEEKAEKDKKDAPAAAGRVAESVVAADSARDERAKENRIEPVMEKPKPAAKANAPAKSTAAPTRSVAGKEFRLVNGIWIDTNYSPSGNAPLVKVKFNSDEYKRILAASPGLKPYFEMQTVVVVWQGKAYGVEK